MADESAVVTQPLRRTTRLALQALFVDFQRNVQGLINDAVADGEVPAGAQLDPDRAVWVLPAAAPSDTGKGPKLEA